MSQLRTRVRRAGSRELPPLEEASAADRLLAERLRQFRLQRNLSQIELAEAAGLTQSTVSGLETARTGMRVDTALALARALKVSLDALLGLDDVLLPEDEDVRKDPFPNRRRLRVMPEFLALPQPVREYLAGVGPRRDLPLWEWIDEARHALRLHEQGRLDPRTLPAAPTVDELAAPRKGQRR